MRCWRWLVRILMSTNNITTITTRTENYYALRACHPLVDSFFSLKKKIYLVDGPCKRTPQHHVTNSRLPVGPERLGIGGGHTR